MRLYALKVVVVVVVVVMMAEVSRVKEAFCAGCARPFPLWGTIFDFCCCFVISCLSRVFDKVISWLTVGIHQYVPGDAKSLSIFFHSRVMICCSWDEGYTTARNRLTQCSLGTVCRCYCCGSEYSFDVPGPDHSCCVARLGILHHKR